MSARYDAIVIGGDIGGLVASIYMAKAGRRVLLLEAEDILGGSCRASTALQGVRAGADAHALYALDPRVVKDLNLTRRGLKFAVRDMPLVGLKDGGNDLLLARDIHAARRAVAAHSPADAEAYEHFRTEIAALARAMRPWWWENAPLPLRLPRAADRRLLAKLRASSAIAMLSEKFESEALRAALAIDLPFPSEPGSALALVWRAAQEMCGLQGAVAAPLGGMPALAELLASMAQQVGVEVRTRARAARLILAGNAASGVELDSGETVFASTVLSSLSRDETLLDLTPIAAAGFDESFALRQAMPKSADAIVLFLLNASPAIGGDKVTQTSRFVIADKPGGFAAGQYELQLEAVIPTAADQTVAPIGQHLLSVCIRGLPLALADGQSSNWAERAVAALAPHAAHLRERIIGVDVHAPVRVSRFSITRLLSSYAQRIETPIRGLFLCGAAAEPVDAVSGRAGRIAADIANGFLAREKR